MNELKIDVKKLVAYFGGRSELHRRLDSKGFKMSIKTIEKWSERSNVPAKRLIQLMSLARLENRSLDLNAFVLSSAPNAKKELSPNRHEDQKERTGR